MAQPAHLPRFENCSTVALLFKYRTEGAKGFRTLAGLHLPDVSQLPLQCRKLAEPINPEAMPDIGSTARPV